MLEGAGTKKLEQGLSFLSISRNRKLEIKPTEIRLSHNMAGIFDFEDFADLVLSRSGRSGGETDYSGFRTKFLFNHFVEHKICWSKVM